MRTYSELITIPTYADRVKYLQTGNGIGEYTAGGKRLINQQFYRSYLWRKLRRQIILRDSGNDLALDGYLIRRRCMIHHIEPISIDAIQNGDPSVYDPENLVCVSFDTHQLIHYGGTIPEPYKERMPNDDIPWR